MSIVGGGAKKCQRDLLLPLFLGRKDFSFHLPHVPLASLSFHFAFTYFGLDDDFDVGVVVSMMMEFFVKGLKEKGNIP